MWVFIITGQSLLEFQTIWKVVQLLLFLRCIFLDYFSQVWFRFHCLLETLQLTGTWLGYVILMSPCTLPLTVCFNYPLLSYYCQVVLRVDKMAAHNPSTVGKTLPGGVAMAETEYSVLSVCSLAPKRCCLMEVTPVTGTACNIYVSAWTLVTWWFDPFTE